MMKKITALIFAFFITLLIPSSIHASETDFVVDTNTEISYATGNDFVNVTVEYVRTVNNSSYYFPASGEKVFHIPDVSDSSEEELSAERKYKVSTLTVVNDKGSNVNYTIEEKESGEGIYVTVPNYKSTTPTSPYKIFLKYQTHDLVSRVGNFITIVGTSLPRETVFDRTDESNGTLTVFNYNLDIVVDGDIPPLSKVFPEFTKESRNGKTYYSFKQTDRIENAPTLEFGTSVLYRFELEYQTSKTDSFIPEKYSDMLGILSTNIYEISLPREFSETNQVVYFENVDPMPKDVYKDSEGNVIALFEIPANRDGVIKINGYITVQQDEWSENDNRFDISFSDYLEKIKSEGYISKYLSSGKYWEVNDKYIKEEAEKLRNGKDSLLEIIKADYQYVGEKLEYDQEKATSENERIGAKKALEGGSSVCMEYADVMIALLRAQGIPSRAAIGYANLEESSPNGEVRHQWVQLWIPDYGWLSIDPTFESNNIRMGQMIDRVLWEVFSDDSLSNIKIYSANNATNLTTEGYTVKIYGVSDELDLSNMMSVNDLSPDNEVKENSTPNVLTLGSTILKTTVLGKALIIATPILIVLVVLIVGISVIRQLHKKSKARRVISV